MFFVTSESLHKISKHPCASPITFENDEASYFGTMLPLHGKVAVKVTLNEITAELTNYDRWEIRSHSASPPGTWFAPGDLFRLASPGNLIEDHSKGQITTPSNSWKGIGALFSGSSRTYGTKYEGDHYRFSLDQLSVCGVAYGNEIAVVRHIYSGASWNANAEIQGNTLLIRGFTTALIHVNAEMLSVTYHTPPAEPHSEAVWHMLSLVSGNTVRHFADEYFDHDGNLIEVCYRIGSSVDDNHRKYFNVFHGPVSPNGCTMIANGIYRLMKVDFPIQVILQHLHQAAGRAIDIEAQHLVLAIHTAIEGWNRLFGSDYWIDDDRWKTFQRVVRKALIPVELCEDLGTEMAANIRSTFRHLNRTSTRWREQEFFKAVSIDISDMDTERALKYRNDLLHNGFFKESWQILDSVGQQQRIHDIERLRRIVLLIIFRLTRYCGTYVNPITFKSEHVELGMLPSSLL